MRYSITSAQLSFFQKEKHLELEAFYSEEELSLLNELLEKAETTHPTGRDLERENPPLFKALQLRRLGQVAAGLFPKKQIRLAFTQLYPPFDEKPLEEVSCVTKMLGAALVDLSSGNIVFITEDSPTDFSGWFVIAFATEKARYQLQENDPHTHLLKKLGYGFGDRLSEQTHHIIASS